MGVRKDYSADREDTAAGAEHLSQSSGDKQDCVIPRPTLLPALPPSAPVLRNDLPLALTGPWTLC